MRQIYQTATEVVIWLGNADTKSDKALAVIPFVVEAAQGDAATGVTRNLLIPQERPDSFPWASDPIWEDLAEIFRRPWFQRAWVVQELAVASKATMLCGDSAVPFDDMLAAFEYLLRSNHTILIQGRTVELGSFARLVDARKAFIDEQKASPLGVLLKQRETLASDNRDKLFAFHGLFKPETLGASATMPDYGLSCLEVYRRFACETLTTSRNLDLLSVPRVTERSAIGGLPTWVPDWSCSDLCASLLTARICSLPSFQPWYSASDGSSYDPVFIDSNSKLLLKGHIFDAIHLLSEPFVDSEGEPEDEVTTGINHQQQFSALENVAITHVPGTPMLSYPRTGEHAQEAYWQTLMTGCADPYKSIMRSAFYKWWTIHLLFRILQFLRLDKAWVLVPFMKFWTMLNVLLYMIRPATFGKSFVNDPLVLGFKFAMNNLGYRRMLKTDSGLLGLAPRCTQVGDFLAICKGGKVPLVIRPKVRATQGSVEILEWELIGESYVHGAMDGSLWRELEGKGAAQDIVLI